VSACDREASITRRSWPTGGQLRHGEKREFVVVLIAFIVK